MNIKSVFIHAVFLFILGHSLLATAQESKKAQSPLKILLRLVEKKDVLSIEVEYENQTRSAIKVVMPDVMSTSFVLLDATKKVLPLLDQRSVMSSAVPRVALYKNATLLKAKQRKADIPFEILNNGDTYRLSRGYQSIDLLKKGHYFLQVSTIFAEVKPKYGMDSKLWSGQLLSDVFEFELK